MKKEQIVFVKTRGYLRQGEKVEVIKAKVLSVGKKYFTLGKINDDETINEHYFRNKFDIIDMCDVSKYSPEFKVYATMREIEDERDKPIIRKEIEKFLDSLSAYDLRIAQRLIETRFDL